MGSLEEFKQCVALVAKHNIVPDVDTTLDSLEKALDGFVSVRMACLSMWLYEAMC
jgi:hypothetical protein